MKMKTHLQVLGWLYIIFGVLGILFALGLALVIAGGGWISGDEVAIQVTSIVAACLGGAFIAFSIPGIIVGAGMTGMKGWIRVPAIILGILNLLNFPIGTALGVYTLYVMLDADTVALFES